MIGAHFKCINRTHLLEGGDLWFRHDIVHIKYHYLSNEVEVTSRWNGYSQTTNCFCYMTARKNPIKQFSFLIIERQHLDDIVNVIVHSLSI